MSRLSPEELELKIKQIFIDYELDKEINRGTLMLIWTRVMNFVDSLRER